MAGAGHGRVPCSFCERTFGSEDAARQHEESYHRKRMRDLRQKRRQEPVAKLDQVITQDVRQQIWLARARRILGEG